MSTISDRTTRLEESSRESFPVSIAPTGEGRSRATVAVSLVGFALVYVAVCAAGLAAAATLSATLSGPAGFVVFGAVALAAVASAHRVSLRAVTAARSARAS